MSLVWRPGFQFDADASTYIEAVEVADGQALETDVRYAINNFVIGCKQDGIWDAIKASCILAGARTLAGALVPLVGTAPTKFGTEANWSYNRKTGLQGDGSTNYLNSNRNNNADPQNSSHSSVFVSTFPTTGVSYIGAGATDVGTNNILATGTRNRSANAYVYAVTSPLGFIGMARSTSSIYDQRASKITQNINETSQSPYDYNSFVFARNLLDSAALFSDARLAFYSIGESLDLALLDSRVTDLITAFGAAIP